MSGYRFSGARLREHRQRAGLQVEHVALSVARKANTIAKYESGDLEPPANIVGALAAAVDVSPTDLYVAASEAVPV
jgi:ribosome-binding protein aMBF1 (putative translation factor)